MRSRFICPLVLVVLGLAGGVPRFVSAQSGCSQVDVVFVMDTPSSMNDEIDDLCALITNIATRFEAAGANVEVTLLGITEARLCLTDTVGSRLGDAIPGSDPGCAATLRENESWGGATAIVAERFAWRERSSRLVVPISDVSACRGRRSRAGCTANDEASIANAIARALENDVTVAPLLGTGVLDCVVERAENLATSTGGLVLRSPELEASSGGNRAVARERLIESLLELALDSCSDAFLRGDANTDLDVSISDPIFTLQMLFAGGPSTSCFDAADSNGDSRVDLSDPVFTLNYLLLRGAPPGAPFPDCGRDPDDQAPNCVVGCRAA